MDSGIVCRQFRLKPNVRRDFKLQMNSGGIVNLFPSKESISSDSKPSTDLGKEHDSLWLMDKSLSDSIFPIEFGSVINRFASRLHSSRDFRFPMDSGRDVKRLPSKYSPCRDFKFPIDSGRDSNIVLYRPSLWSDERAPIDSGRMLK